MSKKMLLAVVVLAILARSAAAQPVVAVFPSGEPLLYKQTDLLYRGVSNKSLEQIDAKTLFSDLPFAYAYLDLPVGQEVAFKANFIGRSGGSGNIRHVLQVDSSESSNGVRIVMRSAKYSGIMDSSFSASGKYVDEIRINAAGVVVWREVRTVGVTAIAQRYELIPVPVGTQATQRQ